MRVGVDHMNAHSNPLNTVVTFVAVCSVQILKIDVFNGNGTNSKYDKYGILCIAFFFSDALRVKWL